MALSAALIGGLAFVGFSGATFTDTSRTTTTAQAAPDWTPPVVEMVDPGSNVIDTVTLTANAYDETSAIAGVSIQYAPSSTSVWTTLCTSITSPYTCSWDTTQVSDGDYDLRAVATDTEGNQQTSEVVETYVSNTERRLVDLHTIPSPIRGNVVLEANFYGHGNKPISMRFQYWTGSTWADLPGCGARNGRYQTCSVDTTALADGSWDFRVLAKDKSDYIDQQTGVVIDNTRPSVTIDQAVGQLDPTGQDAIAFAVVFDEPVFGFETGDITLSGSAVTGSTVATVNGEGTGRSYSVIVTGMADAGSLTASVAAGVAQDLAGNDNRASTSTDNTVTRDTVAPTVTINQASGQADPTNGSPVSFTVVFSKPVTGFETGDVTLSGTASGSQLATVSGSGTTYDVTVTGMLGDGTVVADVAPGVALDAAGNANLASTSTDNTVLFDQSAPTVTVEQASTQADPTRSSPVKFTVEFSEPVTGFTAADVTTTNGNKSVSGSGSTYTVSISSMSQGEVTVTVPAGGALDAAGNGNTASISVDNTVTYDTVRPRVTLNQADEQADPTNSGPIYFTVVFDEPVTGLQGSDFSFSSGTAPGTKVATVLPSNDGMTYTIAVTGMTGTGTVVPGLAGSKVTDAAGNQNVAATYTDRSVTYDTAKPTVTINQASGQADPTNGSPINFTVVFSKPVTGFETGDVTLSGTSGGSQLATVSGSGTTYNVAVTGMSGDGTVVASLAAGVAQDAAGNDNEASTSADSVVRFDDVAPSVTINQAAGQADPTNGSTINFTVVFSEPVTGFTTGEVTLGGTSGGTKVGTVTGSGTTYNVAVTGMTGQGTVVATIAGSVATDAAGNSNSASTSTDNTVTRDTVAPTVTINQASGQADPTKNSPINFTVVFTESVTGFSTGKVTLGGTSSGGTKVGTVTGSGTTYNVAVTGMTGNGTVTASVAAGRGDGCGRQRQRRLDEHRQHRHARHGGADRDGRAGLRPGRSDERVHDQLHGGLQRSRDRVQHRQGHLGWHDRWHEGRHGDRERDDVQRGGDRDDRSGHGDRVRGCGRCNGCSRQRELGVDQHRQHRHRGHGRADGHDQPGLGPGGPDERVDDQLHRGLQ